MEDLVYLTEVSLESIVPGTQVLYIPMHAGEDVTHDDVEEGFITSMRDNGTHRFAFVRFFLERGKGLELRSRDSSVSCDLWSLALGGDRDQAFVDKLAQKCLMQSNLYWKPGMASSIPMTQSLEQGADAGTGAL
jgi:hypothetical protein